METLYTQILALLAQKKTLFSEFESVTETMYCMQAEDLAAAMDQRGLLLEQVAELDRQLAACAAGREDIRAALAHSCGREDLAPQLAEIYDAALAVKAVVNRLIKNKDSIYLHLESEKQRIRAKMEELNSGGASVAERYHQSVLTSVSPQPKKTDKII